MNPTKKSFLTSIVALVLCLTMFLGTTFAWFTDIVVSGGNIIQSGKLDAEMYWSDEYLASTDSGWTQVKDNKPIFTYDNWEPGYTEIKYIKVANAGNLNFKWKLSIEAEGKVTDLSDVIDVYYVNPVNGELTKQALAARTPDGKLTDVLANKTATEGDQLTPGGSVVLAIAFHMDELAGNEYQQKSLCDKGFSLKLLATQATGENDSFDDQYDKESEWPEIPSAGNNASADVPTDANGVVTTATTITGNGMSATVPAGTQLTQGTNKLTLSVNNVEDSKANVTLGDGEELRALDVHVSGVAEGNTTPIAVTLIEALPKGLNIGNYTLYHVEDGQTVPMTLPADGATPVHNNFTYDPVTGDVTLYMASFSEVGLIADTENAWEGNLDYSWYTETIKENPEAKDFVIANADQLAAFGAIVGGMKKVTERVDGKYTYSDEVIQDSFAGQTVKLIADINIGDLDSENGLVFYPIGYWNNEGTYERLPADQRVNAVSSGLRNFEGTFDGNGHTIANFYHNTWEMKGDHDWYNTTTEQYYRDGMGLFGRVYKGTVKNLTVKNFSSDGEIATTGVIAAYADGATFENIAIFNCNPRVYNIGNGGIVGCVGWYAKEKGLTTTFTNITVDNSNKISALWGSYDVACGGIVGQYYPTSGQSSATYPVNAGMHFENCHVSAQMDVYNDVCANYQYYAYRYTGMLIGSVRENVTIDGHSYPKMDGITAKDCTVHFGTWNDYYYCEIIDNTTASYTHDYQMSRLTEIKAIDGTTITYLDGTTGTVPASGRANYVIVDYTKGHGTENATCYHFKDGAVWNHEDAGYHDGTDGGKIIDENGDGKPDLREDKQHIYLEFNNLVTGYGWGVTSRGFHNLDGVTNLDIDEGNQESSIDKFEAVGNINTYRPGQPIRVGDLFTAKDGVTISGTSVLVSVSAVVDGEVVSATFALDAQDWRNSTITFSSDSVANAKVTITDYIFCNPTEIVLTKENKAPKFTANSVGEKDAYTQITLGDLFNAIGDAKIGDVIATVTSPNGTTTINATNSDWATKVINLNKSGSWSISIKDNDDYCTETAVTFNVKDINKFSANSVGAQNAYTQITLGDLFNAIVDDSEIGTVTATVVAPNSSPTTITGTSADWATKSITLVKDGEWTVKITDNASCVEAGVTFTVNKVNKFAKTFTNTNFTYRIGNVNAVAFNSLFTDSSSAIPAVNRKVTFTNVNGNASATINGDSIQFSGNGKITVTVSADGTNDATVTLEVIDAHNATGAQSTYVEKEGVVTFANNVVLLNDTTFSSLEVSHGYSFYGNGFTLTCGSDSVSLSFSQFVKLDNSTIDNVQIVCPNYDYAALYSSQLKGDNNRNKTDNGTTRYYNAKSAVLATGNSQILNSRISGGRSALETTNGNIVVDNSRLEGGAVATVIISAANSFVFRDTTLIQKPTASTYDSSKTLMGMSVLYLCDKEGNATSTTIEGDFVQYAWVDSNCTSYMPTGTSGIASTVLGKTNYTHTVDGKTCVNLGFAYMPSDDSKTVDKPSNITDNRNDKGTIPYAYESVSATVPVSGLNVTISTYVYSYMNSSGTNDSFKTILDYIPNRYSDILTVSYSDTSDGLTLGKTFGTDGWVYELNVDLDKISGYKFDFSKLSMNVNGVAIIDYKVNGSAKPSSTIAVIAGGTTYTLSSTVNGNECAVTLIVTGVETSKRAPYLVDENDNEITVDQVNWGAGICVKKSSSSTDYTGAAPVLENIYIKYWSVAESTYKTVKLSDLTPKNVSGKVNDTNNYWTSSASNNDYSLTVTNTNEIHSTKHIKGMPVVKGGKMYFIINSVDGFVTSGSGAREITIEYEFVDNNGQKLKFNHTWKIAYDKSSKNYYKDFGGSTGCFAEGSLVTLADGTQKPIEDITFEDQLLAWDFFTGTYVATVPSLIDRYELSEQNVINLQFADGTVVRVVIDHGFFDVEANKFVFINEENVASYVGHTFAKASENGTYENVELVGYEITVENIAYYSIQTAVYNNCIVEGVFTLCAPPEMIKYSDWFNYFEIGEGMKYDEEKMQADIEQYGLYTYEDFAEYVTYEQFMAFNGPYLKVLVGRGVVTYEQIIELIRIYVNPEN